MNNKIDDVMTDRSRLELMKKNIEEDTNGILAQNQQIDNQIDDL